MTFPVRIGQLVFGKFLACVVYLACVLALTLGLPLTLGAYGKLGHADGRTHFLPHIPAAVALLRETVARIPGMEQLVKLLARLPTT